MQTMIKQFLATVLTALLVFAQANNFVVPAYADYGAGGQLAGFWQPPKRMVISGPSCGATGGSSTPSFDITSPGDNTGGYVHVLMFVMQRGSGLAGVTSATADGNAMTEIRDSFETISGSDLQTAFYITTAPIVDDGTITSAAVLGSAEFEERICIYTINATQLDNIGVWGACDVDGINSVSINCTPGNIPGYDTTVSGGSWWRQGGTLLSLCTSADQDGVETVTWTNTTEVSDDDGTEMQYSFAQTDATSIVAQAAITCDYTGTADDVLLMSVTVGNIWPNQAVTVNRATCVHDVSNLQDYTFSDVATGAASTDWAVLIAFVLSEDSAATYDVDGVTFNGVAATLNSVDANAIAVDVMGAFSDTPVTGADSVDVTVSFTEAITQASVCLYAITGGISKGNGIHYTEAFTHGTASTSGQGEFGVTGGFIIGGCVGSADTSAFTTGGTRLSETEDVDGGEIRVVTYTGTMNGTVDYTAPAFTDGVSTMDCLVYGGH